LKRTQNCIHVEDGKDDKDSIFAALGELPSNRASAAVVSRFTLVSFDSGDILINDGNRYMK